MAAAFYFFIGALVFWLAFRSGAKRAAQTRPDPREADIERLNARVRTLEQIITDRDWRLRRDFDGLG